MRIPSDDGADRRRQVRGQVYRLVLAVALVDALFIAGYYVCHLERASSRLRIGYTAAWTAATLLIVLRGLGRLRALRRRLPGAGGNPRG